ncbi:hypothetical protein NS355_14635 [Sphingomonas yabuuchiae]|uniref:Uncharacterized protein n=1 Tax=Sphingomonas yabuuchiae TaxID=172044 RepID=A0A147IM00_9SPHN|nr:hypothetical protein NS355_14635 [Sphingomonas yabuuchiae]
MVQGVSGVGAEAHGPSDPCTASGCRRRTLHEIGVYGAGGVHSPGLCDERFDGSMIHVFQQTLASDSRGQSLRIAKGQGRFRLQEQGQKDHVFLKLTSSNP